MAHTNLRFYLPNVVAATAAVVGLPLLVVLGLVVVMEPDPALWVTALIGMVLSLLTSVIGTAIWHRRPESVDVSFGELMVWGWLRRRRAEERLARGERLLGVDQPGEASNRIRLDREEQLAALKELTSALESKDPYTHGHSRRVERHVRRTAERMGLSQADIEEVAKAAALHDVGKIRIPDRILRKEDALTIEEKALFEEHTLVGAWMVSAVGTADVVLGVRHHHERWDGKGYPDGLAGRNTPLFARIIAVADAYDAMTSTRPYRPALGRDNTLEVIKSEARVQFDPVVVDAFIETLPTRIPAAAFLPLSVTPAWARRATGALTRAGAGSITSGIAAVGVAALLGSVVVSPPSLNDVGKGTTISVTTDQGDSEDGEDTRPATIVPEEDEDDSGQQTEPETQEPDLVAEVPTTTGGVVANVPSGDRRSQRKGDRKQSKAPTKPDKEPGKQDDDDDDDKDLDDRLDPDDDSRVAAREQVSTLSGPTKSHGNQGHGHDKHNPPGNAYGHDHSHGSHGSHGKSKGKGHSKHHGNGHAYGHAKHDPPGNAYGHDHSHGSHGKSKGKGHSKHHGNGHRHGSAKKGK